MVTRKGVEFMNTSQAMAKTVVNRQKAIETYRDNRARTEALFRILSQDAYYERPVPLRHPPVFYDGHIPAFAVNSFLKKGLGHPGLDSDLEELFARGIDPSDQDTAEKSAVSSWPRREQVRQYVQNADAAICQALTSDTIESEKNEVLHRGQGVWTMLEHEVMHQETLLYMWHRFDFDKKTCPANYTAVGVDQSSAPTENMVTVPGGEATLGAGFNDVTFGWDNEFPLMIVDVSSFAIDAHNVTNENYLAFVEAGGYQTPEYWSVDAWQRLQDADRSHPLFWESGLGGWHWRGMFERIPLPLKWPVYVTHDEASAFARWKRLRLPTEAEFHRAAYGTPNGAERLYPWGNAEIDSSRGNFDFQHWDPVPVGSYSAGKSAWGVHDLVGNGWEWTSTVFAGFPGFRPMASYPEYSADFFDGDHFVVKGASPVTGRALIRPSFRNWFRPSYPYMYATFRCVMDIAER